MNIYDDTDNHRYVVEVDGNVAGFAVYKDEGESIMFIHTEIDTKYEGQGIGSALARFALDDAKSRNLKVIAICPFISGWIERHDDYKALLASGG